MKFIMAYVTLWLEVCSRGGTGREGCRECNPLSPTCAQGPWWAMDREPLAGRCFHGALCSPCSWPHSKGGGWGGSSAAFCSYPLPPCVAKAAHRLCSSGCSALMAKLSCHRIWQLWNKQFKTLLQSENYPKSLKWYSLTHPIKQTIKNEKFSLGI